MKVESRPSESSLESSGVASLIRCFEKKLGMEVTVTFGSDDEVEFQVRSNDLVLFFGSFVRSGESWGLNDFKSDLDSTDFYLE